MPQITDMALGDRGRLSCGCEVEVWRRYKGHSQHGPKYKDVGGVEHWVKRLSQACTRNTCVLRNSELRCPVLPWTQITQDPLANELETRFGDN